MCVSVKAAAAVEDAVVEEVKSRSSIRLYPLPYEVLRNCKGNVVVCI